MEKASLPFSPLSEHVKETHTHKQESQSGSVNFSPTSRRYVKSDLTLANRVVGSEGTVLKGGHTSHTPPQSLSAWTQQLRDLVRTEQRNGMQCGLSATTTRILHSCDMYPTVASSPSAIPILICTLGMCQSCAQMSPLSQEEDNQHTQVRAADATAYDVDTHRVMANIAKIHRN